MYMDFENVDSFRKGVMSLYIKVVSIDITSNEPIEKCYVA